MAGPVGGTGSTGVAGPVGAPGLTGNPGATGRYSLCHCVTMLLI